MTKTSFAVVGTGIVGERIIKQLLANDNAKIIALFDEDKKRKDFLKWQIHMVFVRHPRMKRCCL